MEFVKSKWFDSLDSAPVISDPEMVVGASYYAVTAEWTGSPNTGATVALEGSIDGSSWVTLGTVVKGAGDVNMTWIVDRPVAFIRLRNAAMNEGTDPTVTVSVIAG
jgi:hypothetical protein